MKNISKILFLSLFSTFLSAQVYVNDDATGANDGTSWADAYTELNAAIFHAPAGSQIWVAAGTYYPTSGTNRLFSFNIDKNLELYGGLQGNETALPTGACIDPTLSVLDGDIGVLGDNSDNTYHVIYTQNTSNITISGFTIQNGNADGGVFVNNSGGGMYNDRTSPTIINCIFQNNIVDNRGGAIFNDAPVSTTVSSPTITDCVFQNNTANARGGGIFNNATRGTSSPIFTNVVFYNNSAGVNGGAISNVGVSGGNSIPIFTNVVFYNNTATNTGGAVYNGGQDGNSSPIFNNVTFYNNTAVNNGGAVMSNGTGSGSPNSAPIFNNTIFWGNTATNGNILYNNEATPTIDYSLVDVADCATLLSDSDDGLSTTTCGSNMLFNQDPLFIDVAGGNFRLQCSSPAIDVGTATGAPAFDLENVPRPQNGLFDMGAYEGCISPVLTITTQPTSQVANCGDNASFLVTANTTLGTLTYQWQNDCSGSFTDIPSETNATLNLTNVGLNDACNYRVVVDDGTNCEISDVVSLTINSCCDLTIDTQPQDQTICNGDDATFTVAASSSGTLSYQWQQVCSPTFTNYTQADDGISGGGIRDVYVDGNNFYIGGSTGLSISTDNGATWTNYTTADGLGDNSISGIVESGGVIYATSLFGGGISTSSDGGATWSTITTADGIGDNALSDVEVVGGNIYVTSGSGTLSVSSDGGVTWTIYNSSNGLSGNLRDVEIVGGNIYVASNTGLFISMDGGTTFTQYTGFPSNDLESVFVSPSGNIYVSSTSGGFSVSNDGGATWQDFSTADGLPSNLVYDVIESSGVIYAASGGLSISYDGGTTWDNYDFSDGLSGNTVYDIYEDNGLIYVGTDGGFGVVDFNLTDITGANAASYTFTPTLPQDTTCSYRVIVSDDNGCSVTSDLVSLTVNGTPDIATITAQSNACPNETAFDLSTLTVTDNNSVTGTTTTFHTAAPSSATDMTNQITGAGLMISSSQTVFVMMATGAGCFDVESFMVNIGACCAADSGTWN